MDTIRIKNITSIINNIIEINKSINQNDIFTKVFGYSILTNEELKELKELINLNKQRLLQYIRNSQLLFD